ncbi:MULTISPECIES: Coenzyme F420 hydrogenase/dehydrogenase, beta subunit C-terminal domain [Pseudomonas]|uniref:Coenzyme F420 hydrogenase/dehydrogenase, beta subunit C-terminal domain n=1 Tax=Pseudomonas TaxID=286 RepID=UPI001473812B|nr:MULTISPECIES: Coenzyme F420 hydrogenase/dehydrogenase, beta subunit C-terminal domain [Pseudomonas]MBM1204800.1 coenzyme F420 hydrogenase [Pseudomonas fragi]MBM1204896.1 coenzyme F420 hydrogenase [Pseudomonas fragi]
MRLDEYGRYKPYATASLSSPISSNIAQKVCPFSDTSRNEDEISSIHYKYPEKTHKKLGRFEQVIVGHAEEGNFRGAGSSGGLTNWILHELLASNQIDAVIGVGKSESADKLFEYKIIESAAEISLLSKSKYYPVELSKVLQKALASDNKTYAIVGTPCFIKATRNLCLEHPEFAKKIKYFVAIVCGHLKSTGFAESLAWQVDVLPHQLTTFDFRVKQENKPANRYAIRATGHSDNIEIQGQAPVFDLYGTDWGLGYFKLKGCDYCDDIAGETADITLGDAWLPADIQNYQGTNIAVVRSKHLLKIIESAKDRAAISYRLATADDFIISQAANYRHRHDGLSYRLFLADKQSEWRPKKRIEASDTSLDAKRKKVIELRTILMEKSHIAFKEAKAQKRFSKFKRALNKDFILYYYYSGSLLKIIAKTLIIKWRRVLHLTKIKSYC